MTPLAEALGHPAGTSLLIVTCDELGVSHASNSGVYSAMREGMGQVGGLVVPGPGRGRRRPATGVRTSAST